MTGADEITVLRRAHDLFAGNPSLAAGGGPASDAVNVLRQPAEVTGSGFARYRTQADTGRSALMSTNGVDERLNTILQGAADEHSTAAHRTRVILDAARADSVPAADTPMGQRELMARRAARLRAQHRILTSTRARALRRLALIRALRYRGIDPSRLSSMQIPGAPNPRAAIAVKFALSKIGLPYVWGATGPNAYDCSGLTQAAWKAAGIDISRTTYTQIDHGVPVPRSMAAVGDLVFPHAGHVQMYIGNNQVVEAPHSGANVRISQLAANVQIRRPLAA